MPYRAFIARGVLAALLLLSRQPAAAPMAAAAERSGPAATPTTREYGTDLWIPGSTPWGSRGLLRLEAAHAVRRNAWIFAIDGSIAATSDALFTGDRLLTHGERLHVLWATPLRGLEAGLSAGLETAYNHTFVDHMVQTAGRPTLNLKYSHAVHPHVGLGVMAELIVPSAVGTNGLVPRGLQLTALALGTYRFSRFVEASANVGYTLDRSQALGDGGLLPEQRLAFGIGNYSGVRVGIGAIGRIDVAEAVALGPFLEFTGRINQGVTLEQSPTQGSIGLKAYMLDAHLVELTLACDARASGRPELGGSYPGILPWTARAALSFHLFDSPAVAPAGSRAGTCRRSTECVAGATCVDHMCTVTKEVIKEVMTFREVRPDSFTVSGRVLDSNTLRPVQDALVTIAGFEKTPLSVDYRTGAYHSFPLPAGDSPLQVRATAPGYSASELNMARGKADEDRTLQINMVRDTRPATGTLQGTCRDSRTGRPVPRTGLFVIAVQQRFAADEQGSFTAPVKAGRYDVVIAAKGYITQRRKVVIHEGEVVIFDVDMVHARQAPK